MKMNLRLALLSPVITVCSMVAQNRTVVGTVISAEDGQPVIGAAVVVKGTTIGTVTDMDGKFTLEVPENGKLLNVSYVGMRSQDIAVGANVKVVLQTDSQNLDELVVVAYGTAKKSSFTGSASVVKADQLEKINGSGFVEALQGMSAGVNVSNNVGTPGADPRIQIRGISSMSGVSTPLYVVDGMPYDGALNSINPSDIESMTVLKDAAASSLYGSRAANGVVVITTKKGKSGKPTINFRGSWGTSDLAVPHPTKADPYQQLTNVWRAIYNDQYYKYGKSQQEAGDYASQTVLSHHVVPRINSKGETVYVTPFKWTGDVSNYVLHDGKGNCWTNPDLEMVWNEEDYDWYDAVFDKKLRQEYGLDLSGSSANGKTQYFTSLGFLDDKGYANDDFYRRYSFRANVNSEITDWLSMGGNLAYTYARKNTRGYGRALVFSNTLNSPWLRNADNTDWCYSEKTGDRMYDYANNSANFFGEHPVGKGNYWNNPNDESFNSNEFSTVSAKYFAEIKLPFDLKFRTAVNLDDNTQNDYGYGSAIHGDGGQLYPYGITVKTTGGNATRTTYKTTSVTWNNLLTWDKTFGEHSFNAMLGHEYYHYNQQYTNAYGEGIMQLGQFELSSTTMNWSNSSNRIRYALLSFFGKIDYNFANRYYLSASFRRDGSSRFSKDSRWGNFFSVGGSWRLSKEAFMENATSWLDNLALRASFGTSGNDKLYQRNGGSAGSEIYYAYQGYYTSDNLYGMSGYKPSTIATPDLKWEKNKQFNAAVDFGFLGRLNGTIEYYTRNSADLLYYKDLPLSAQVGDATGYNTNLGNVRNQGVEITLNFTAIKNRDFEWNIDFNFSTLSNKVTYLPSGPYNYQVSSAYYRLEEGKSLYEFYMPKNAGVNPENGNMQYWIKDGNGGWKTTENYAEVTTEDYQWCGSSIPKAFGSITNNLKWKNWDLSMMWYASFGSKMFDYGWLEGTTVRDGVGLWQDQIEGKVWEKPGDNAKFPRWSADDYSSTRKTTDFYLFNNDYLRLRNLTVGYTLPRVLTQKLHLSYARLYLSGDNLFTFGSAAKRHSDPETELTGNNYNGNSGGVQSSRRVFMGGIQISF